MKYIFKEKDTASLITIPHIQMSMTEMIIPEEKFTVNDIRFYDASLSTQLVGMSIVLIVLQTLTVDWIVENMQQTTHKGARFWSQGSTKAICWC